MLPRHSLRSNLLRWRILKVNASSAERTLFIRASALSQSTAPKSPIGHRNFSSSPSLYKKKTKADREKDDESSSSAPAEAEDPSDFSALQDGIKKALAKLDNDLSKLRTGGRFNPDVLESVRVNLVKGSKATERLGDLAQVLPKGRMVTILVGEKDHVKPVTSAIQAARELNLQPQQDAQNQLQLNVPIPPPTKESRDQALKAASKAGEDASVAVRNARAAVQKKLRAMEVKKVARPDDLKKAHKEMEKIVEKGTQDIKKAVDAARKTMEQS